MSSGTYLNISGEIHGTAKRLRLKAQGCFNPGEQASIVLNPERVAPVDTTALRLNRLSNSVTQGSRSGNPGLKDETALR